MYYALPSYPLIDYQKPADSQKRADEELESQHLGESFIIPYQKPCPIQTDPQHDAAIGYGIAEGCPFLLLEEIRDYEIKPYRYEDPEYLEVLERKDE